MNTPFLLPKNLKYNNLMNSTRLDKFLSAQGYCSRRKVEDFLTHKFVTINGKRVKKPGERFDPSKDKLLINNKPIKLPENVYYIVNKPLGYVSTVDDEHNRKTVTSLVKTKERIYPVGRLDIDSHGLVLLTNDGDLTYKLTHPKFHIPKTYIVTINTQVTHKQRQYLRNGVRLKSYTTAPAQVDTIKNTPAKTVLEMKLHEGKNRQIRRMCKAINLEVVDLQRIAIGPITLGDLGSGDSRPLSEKEIKLVKSLLKS